MTTNALATLPNFAQNLMPTLPAEMRDILLANFAPAMDTFGGGFNRVSLKGNRIRLIVGGQEVRQEPNALDFVILGISPDQYCVWYQNKYNGEEGVEPDAIWAMGEQPPSNVPASVMVKDADGRNQFSVRRRIVIAAVAADQAGQPFVDLENPFVFDMGGMTTFGEDINIGNFAFGKAYSFSNYMGLMKTHGMIPAACMTKMMFDQSQSVPVIRFVPIVNAQGQIQVLDPNTLMRVVETIKDPKITELLDWRRGAPAAAPATEAAQAPIQQAAQQVVQQPAQQPVQQTVQQPVQQAPVQQAPVQQTVAQQTVAQQAVQQPAPQQTGDLNNLANEMTQAVQQAQQAPVQETVAQQPVQQAPVQQAPVQQQPVQQTVAQQPAPQQTVAQQAPVGDDALKSALAGLMDDGAFA